MRGSVQVELAVGPLLEQRVGELSQDIFERHAQVVLQLLRSVCGSICTSVLVKQKPSAVSRLTKIKPSELNPSLV